MDGCEQCEPPGIDTSLFSVIYPPPCRVKQQGTGPCRRNARSCGAVRIAIHRGCVRVCRADRAKMNFLKTKRFVNVALHSPAPPCPPHLFQPPSTPSWQRGRSRRIAPSSFSVVRACCVVVGTLRYFIFESFSSRKGKASALRAYGLIFLFAALRFILNYHQHQ